MIWRRKSRFSASRLGVLLGATLVMALLPLGILSMVQTWYSRDQVLQTTLDGISGASQDAVRTQIDVIRDAQATAKTISYMFSVGLPIDLDSCRVRMEAVNDALPQTTLVAMIPREGPIFCASTPDHDKIWADPILSALPNRDEPALTFSQRGPISGRPIIVVSAPVFDQSGQLQGAVVVALLHNAVAPDFYQNEYGLWKATLIATYTGEGELLAADRDAASIAPLLPTDLDLTNLRAVAGRPAFFEGSDHKRQILSVTSVAEDVFLLALWQQDNSPTVWAAAYSPFLLPALTWAAALIASYIAAQRLVVRHVRALARSMTAYMASRTRNPVPGIQDSPAEIQRLHAVYEELISAIEHDEAELENLLVDKDRLMREVHHRSGNSLQIIASVMRMYRRESGDPGLRNVLDGLINRVIALSSTHTSLYGLEGRNDVPMDEVLNAVIRRLKEIHGIPLGSARKQFQPIALPAQTAIPLALALAEAVSCHFAAKEGMNRGVDVALDMQGDDIRLYIEGPDVPEFRPETTHGLRSLPRRMLTQFAGQLRGRVVTRIEGDRSIVELSFPRRPQ